MKERIHSALSSIKETGLLDWSDMNSRIVEIIVILAITAFLFTYFKPDLVFSPTHISAGDTVGHYFGMYYLNKALMPSGEIIGWCPEWFLGYPMFQFYFPFLFSLGALLGYIIQLPVAFKIITVLGTFMLPVCAFICLRLMKFEFPVPLIGAIFTLPYLFLENYSMYGGNIPSTLAGEFAYVFSLSIMLVLIGSLYNGIRENKNIMLNSILFAITTLSHVFPAIFAIGASSFFLLNRNNFWENFKYLFKVFGLGLLLAGFWFIPMVAKSAYTVPHMWYLPGSVVELWNMLFTSESVKFFPLPLFAVLGLAGMLIGAVKKERKAYYIGFCIAIAFAGLVISGLVTSSELHIFRQFQFIKFIPIFYLFIFLSGACAFSMFSKLRGKILVPIITLILVILYVNNGTTYIQNWINWNYSGYEDKNLWPAYRDANEFLSRLPYARTVFEYDPDRYDSGLGSSRATETIPAFSGQPITEGTHFQSSFNGPFIYFAHCEYSNGCSCVFGPETGGCTGFDMEAATSHLKLFNVKYLFVSSQKLKDALAERQDYRLLYGPAEFEIWEFLGNDGKYVELANYEPIQVKSENWRNISYMWFREYRYNDLPLVWEKEDDLRFSYVYDEVYDIYSLPNEKIENDCAISETISRKEIVINTTCIGKPLIIKVSYFPNWKVDGAKKIYMVSPAFMLVYPEKEIVRLHYGMTLSDALGLLATLIAIGIIVYHYLDRKSQEKINRTIYHFDFIRKKIRFGS